jgi:hypothetical protein
VAVDEPARDVLVERVGQHRRLDGVRRGVAADQLVPAGLRVEHRGPELAARLLAGDRGERLGWDSVASLPRWPTPSASASRRAGSTVSTSTRPPISVAAYAASAAAMVVLPTPPEPHDEQHLLAGEQRSMSALGAARRSGAHHVSPSIAMSSSSASASATSATTRRAGGAGEQFGHDQHREVGARVLEPGEVAGADTPPGLGDAGRVDDGVDAAPGRVDEQPMGLGRGRRRRRLASVEQSGQHTVGDQHRRLDAGLVGQPARRARWSR